MLLMLMPVTASAAAYAPVAVVAHILSSQGDHGFLAAVTLLILSGAPFS